MLSHSTPPPTPSPALAAHACTMRTFSPKLFNEIANSPSVRPALGGSGPLDLGPHLADARNFAFQLANAGGFIALQVYGGVYEVHTVFAPGAARPAEIVNFAAAAQEWMFCRTDAVELITRVPEGNAGAEWLSTKGGFASIGQQKGWQGPGASASIKRLWIEDWALSSAAALVCGQEFHARCADLGLAHSTEDSQHDAMAGAAVMMALRGQGSKAVNLYNHWAVVHGYPLVTLVSGTPLVVDMGEGLLAWEENGKMVLECR